MKKNEHWIAYGLALALSAGAAGSQEKSIPSGDTYCWSTLTGSLGPQKNAVSTGAPAIAANRQGSLWVAWSEHAGTPQPIMLQTRHFDGKTWKSSLLANIEQTNGGVHEPALHVSDTGQAFAFWRTVPGMRSQIAVARWDNDQWQMLGAMLGGLRSAGDDASSPAMVLDSHGQPVVAWQSKGRGGSSLLVARWDGSMWHLLGAPLTTGSDHYFIRSALALDREGGIWIAWKDGKEGSAHLRVSRWNGISWRDIGNLATRRIGKPGKTSDVRLAVLPNGSAVAGWTEDLGFSKSGANRTRVKLATWDGKDWRPLPLPSSPPGIRQRWIDALSVTSDGTLLVALNDRDESEVSTGWVFGHNQNGWRTLLSGMRAAAGSADALDFSLTPGRAGEFTLGWDESTSAQRSHAIHARPCTSGERPLKAPVVRPSSMDWPQSVDAAVDKLVATLDDKAKTQMRDAKREELALYHLGLGMWIRNNYGLWRNNKALLASCGGARIHPDHCSGVIIDRLWQRLRQMPPGQIETK